LIFILMIYLIEPYNAYAPKGKKKHISEIYEEEALFQRMLAEASKTQNPTMPPNTPPTTLATGLGTAAGGGGVPVHGYFKRNDALTLGFTIVTSSATAPSNATFTNVSTYAGTGTLTYKWLLGSGSLTSTSATPSVQAYTVAGTYIVKLEVTESQFGVMKTTTNSLTIA
jgi:PKD repeat protein